MTNDNEMEESGSDDDYPGELEEGSDEDAPKLNGRSSQLSRQVPEEWLEKHKRKIEYVFIPSRGLSRPYI